MAPRRWGSTSAPLPRRLPRGSAVFLAFRSMATSASPRAPPIVSLNVGELDSGEVSDMLSQAFGIATRPGAHCAPLMHRALGTEQRGVVRFSFGWFNTQETWLPPSMPSPRLPAASRFPSVVALGQTPSFTDVLAPRTVHQ